MQFDTFAAGAVIGVGGALPKGAAQEAVAVGRDNRSRGGAQMAEGVPTCVVGYLDVVDAGPFDMHEALRSSDTEAADAQSLYLSPAWRAGQSITQRHPRPPGFVNLIHFRMLRPRRFHAAEVPRLLRSARSQ